MPCIHSEIRSYLRHLLQQLTILASPFLHNSSRSAFLVSIQKSGSILRHLLQQLTILPFQFLHTSLPSESVVYVRKSGSILRHLLQQLISLSVQNLPISSHSASFRSILKSGSIHRHLLQQLTFLPFQHLHITSTFTFLMYHCIDREASISRNPAPAADHSSNSVPVHSLRPQNPIIAVIVVQSFAGRPGHSVLKAVRLHGLSFCPCSTGILGQDPHVLTWSEGYWMGGGGGGGDAWEERWKYRRHSKKIGFLSLEGIQGKQGSAATWAVSWVIRQTHPGHKMHDSC